MRTLKYRNPFSNLSKYYDEYGNPKTLVRAKSSGTGGLSGSDRTTQTLKRYESYYRGDGTVWAAINSIAFNTIMTGYNIYSENDEAKELITKFLRRIDFDNFALKVVIFCLVYGDSFLEIRYNKKGTPVRVMDVDPKTMFIDYDAYGDIEAYHQEFQGSKGESIDPKYISHFSLFPRPESPYGISLIEPSRDTIKRKIRTDEAIANALIRHGFSKYVITVGQSGERQLAPDDVLKDIDEEFEDITEQNEFIVPWNVKVETIDERGIQGVEDYFNYFQAQSATGLLVSEESLGLGNGSTEACNDEKTQVLTLDGWKWYYELSDNDRIATYNPKTNKLEYHKASESVNKYIYDHDGDMVRIKSKYCDMLVTPNHRMYTSKDKDNWEIKEANELLKSGRYYFKSSVDVNNEDDLKFNKFEKNIISKSSIENLMMILGYYISEGSINSNGQPYCRLSQKKEKSSKRIKNVLSEFPYKFKESYSNDKGYEWHLYNKELYTYLKEFGDNCYTKCIPRRLINLPPKYLEILLSTLIDGDGTVRSETQRVYSTTSKQLADDVQEIALKCGYRVQVGFLSDFRNGRCGCYMVYITKNEDGCIAVGENYFNIEYYKGKVYSLNVPNHIYVTRRNGKVAIQGNTATVKAVLFERMLKSFQTKIARIFEKELINKVLEAEGLEPDTVIIQFNSVTEADEANRAKWLGGLLNSFKNSKVKPFTINEIRSMYNYRPINEKWADTLLWGGDVKPDGTSDDNDEEETEETPTDEST